MGFYRVNLDNGAYDFIEADDAPTATRKYKDRLITSGNVSYVDKLEWESIGDCREEIQRHMAKIAKISSHTRDHIDTTPSLEVQQQCDTIKELVEMIKIASEFLYWAEIQI